MDYLPIENYGIIGNMHTIALCGTNGSIDWFCYPHFDSPSVFSSILDIDKGGYFRIQPVDQSYTNKQFYWPDTNVLVTRFLTDEGVCEITDFLPVSKANSTSAKNQLVRRIHCVRGHMKMHLECKPAFNYGRDEHTVQINEKGAAFHSPNLSLALSTSENLQEKHGMVFLNIDLQEGDSANFVIQEIPAATQPTICFSEDQVMDGIKSTITYWRDWLQQSTY
ncbi:MAG: trehalase-like domain-containing protein, partial [Bacteroidota bacterium]